MVHAIHEMILKEKNVAFKCWTGGQIHSDFIFYRPSPSLQPSKQFALNNNRAQAVNNPNT
jgi:hypothetical protein